MKAWSLEQKLFIIQLKVLSCPSWPLFYFLSNDPYVCVKSANKPLVCCLSFPSYFALAIASPAPVKIPLLLTRTRSPAFLWMASANASTMPSKRYTWFMSSLSPILFRCRDACVKP